MTEPGAGGRMSSPTIDAVTRCTEFAAAQAHEAGFSLARVREIELAVEEIVANICRYSYGDQLGSVELCCEQLDGAKIGAGVCRLWPGLQYSVSVGARSFGGS